jgi:DNA-binding response OmpR family regulator
MNTKKMIIAADDDSAILDVLQIMLNDAGYDVRTSLNGESIYTMDDEFPQLFLLDIWMSGNDGREICTYLKSQDTTKHIPVIMISANRDLEEEAKKIGADDFLEKPFNIDDLFTKVAKHIN